MNDEIYHSIEPDVVTEEVIRVFDSAGMHRTDEPDRIAHMNAKENLNLHARHHGKLFGFARSLTDFCYCYYLSDLAVDKACRRREIGKKFIGCTKEETGENTMLLLPAEPTMEGYYPRIEFETVTNGRIIKRS